MAHTLSAKKRIRQNATHRARNRWRKRRIHNAVKSFDHILGQHGAVSDAEEALRKASSILDKVAGKGTIHRNKAARTKSRLARRLNAHRAKG